MPKRPKREPTKTASKARTPLTRERVLRAALAIADDEGLGALSMRRLGQALRVEAMSLYHHVANKDELLDGMVDVVVGEMHIPLDRPWRESLRTRALSAHAVLLQHPWAAALIESRLSPGPERLRHHDALIGVLLRAGFSLELAYRAFLTLDSYIYGFTLQEVHWPFEREERPDVVSSFEPHVMAEQYPHLVQMMEFMIRAGRGDASQPLGKAAAYLTEYTFGLDLLLDGLEAVRARQS